MNGAITKQEKTLAVLAYIPYVNLLTCPLALYKKPESEFCRFHAKQGFSLFIFEFLALFVIGLLPLVGGFVGGVLSTLIGLAFLVLSVWGGVKAGEGVMFLLPIVGPIAQKIPLDKLFAKRPPTPQAPQTPSPPTPQAPLQTPQPPLQNPPTTVTPTPQVLPPAQPTPPQTPPSPSSQIQSSEASPPVQSTPPAAPPAPPSSSEPPTPPHSDA